MEKVKCMCKYVKYELEGAEMYAKEAMKMKELDKTSADMLHTIANEELAHADKLHTICNKYMNMKKSNGELTPVAEEIWNYEKENAIEWTAKIKMLLAMYK